MNTRSWKRIGSIAVTSALFVVVSMTLATGSAAAATTNPVDLTPVTNSVTQTISNLDIQYQLCALQHDLDLQIVWITSYPSQPPVPGFCVPQQPGETALANAVLPIAP